MKIDEKIADLICELEYLVGNQTYNPSSYNGWTGEEGCEYKYPVNYCVSKEALEGKKITKTKSRIEYIAPECINTMKYAFGANHVYIGQGLVDVLKCLEKKYGIDFNALEEKRINEQKRKMKILEEKLLKQKYIVVHGGRYVVGVDIPDGEYIVVNEMEESSFIMINVLDGKGEEIEHLFSREKQMSVKLEKGYRLKVYHTYRFGLDV